MKNDFMMRAMLWSMKICLLILLAVLLIIIIAVTVL